MFPGPEGQPVGHHAQCQVWPGRPKWQPSALRAGSSLWPKYLIGGPSLAADCSPLFDECQQFPALSLQDRLGPWSHQAGAWTEYQQSRKRQTPCHLWPPAPVLPSGGRAGVQTLGGSAVMSGAAEWPAGDFLERGLSGGHPPHSDSGPRLNCPLHFGDHTWVDHF